MPTTENIRQMCVFFLAKLNEHFFCCSECVCVCVCVYLPSDNFLSVQTNVNSMDALVFFRSFLLLFYIYSALHSMSVGLCVRVSDVQTFSFPYFCGFCLELIKMPAKQERKKLILTANKSQCMGVSSVLNMNISHLLM